MISTTLRAFLDRAVDHLDGLPRDRFSTAQWRFDGRPTSEGVGLKPGLKVDVDKMAACVMDVEGYAENVKFVESSTIIVEHSPKDVIHVQKMKVPVIGGVQVVNHLQDIGDFRGYRAIAWEGDDARTAALDPKDGGVRLAYSLGAWLLRPDEVGFAVSTAPRKDDVGSIKYAIMTKGADALIGTTVATNIEAMHAWSERA